MRAVIAAAVSGGLFAMHGLAVPAATARPTVAAHALSASVQPVMVATPMRCGMDHATCVAVLPSPQHPVPAGIALLPVAPVALPAPPVDFRVDGASRAPPDISLTRLCISRT